MKSRSELWLRALSELGAQCSVDTRRDAETLAARVAREGESFFTITLPTFGKELERALSERHIPADSFKGWGRRTRKIHVVGFDEDYETSKTKKLNGGNPKFLGGFLDLVFCDGYWITWDAWDEIPDNETAVSTLTPRLYDLEDDELVERMANAIFAVRQLTLMFSKEKNLCSQERIDEAVATYVKTDEDLVNPFSMGE